MPTYIAIKELSNTENKNLIAVLRYIATNEGYMEGNNIQYKLLYRNVLRPEFIRTAQNMGVEMRVSIRQYNRLRIHRRGKFSVNIFIYLLALYNIMYGYQSATNFNPVINNITYSEYIIELIQEKIAFLIDDNNRIENYLSEDDYNIFLYIYNSIIELDNLTGNNRLKLYNNIW